MNLFPTGLLWHSRQPCHHGQAAVIMQLLYLPFIVQRLVDWSHFVWVNNSVHQCCAASAHASKQNGTGLLICMRIMQRVDK